MRHLMDTLGGLWELALLAVTSGFRLRGPYWRWRHETAFGGGSHGRPGRWQRIRAGLEYGRWVHRMKRGRWH